METLDILDILVLGVSSILIGVINLECYCIYNILTRDNSRDISDTNSNETNSNETNCDTSDTNISDKYRNLCVTTSI